MRRAAVVLSLVTASLWFATPASAFAHNAVHSPALHAVLDGLTLLAVAAPVFTALLWGGGRKWWLAGLIAMVQLPVAVIGFVPIANPYVHLSLFGVAFALTAVSLWIARSHLAPRTQPVAARSPHLQTHD